MKKRTALIVLLLLCFSAVVAAGRLWYRQDVQWGTQHSTTSDGLPLDAVNASVIPLSTGSNVEAVLTSLQAQITSLNSALAAKVSPSDMDSALALKANSSTVTAALALKADAYNPVFTGNGTIAGEWTALQFNTTGGDNTHFAHLGNTGDITVPATDNAGLVWFNQNLNKWRITRDGGTIDNLALEP